MNKISFESGLSHEKLEMIVTLATESNKKLILELRKITEKILWNSIKNQRQSNVPGQIASSVLLSLVALKQQFDNTYSTGSWSRNIDTIALAPQHRLERLEHNLCLALKKIQSINVKELSNIIRINKHQGLEAAIDYILSPYEIPLVPVNPQPTVGTKQLVEIPLIPLDSESEEL